MMRICRFALLLIHAYFLHVLTGRRRETLRRSNDLLRCGLTEPFPAFMAVFLVGLGFMFVAEEVGGGLMLGLLEHTVTFVNDRPLTCRTIIPLVLAFLSSIITA